LSLSNEEIVAQIESMENETKAIKQEALKMCWYMRGGLSYTESMDLSFTEREIIGKIIKEHIETTKESGLPFF
jgi:hypothetical protein